MASGAQRRQQSNEALTNHSKPYITTQDGELGGWAKPLLAMQPRGESADNPEMSNDPYTPPPVDGIEQGVSTAPTTYTPETPTMDTHAADRQKMPWYSLLMSQRGAQA